MITTWYNVVHKLQETRQRLSIVTGENQEGVG